MDGDRKYRQSGYQDPDRGSGSVRSDRPRPPGPKPSLDITGPKLPRLVQNVVASRCYSCTTTLAADMNFKGNCPKCGAALHCCKQCVHFDSSTRYQCTKPVPIRIVVKDGLNDCPFFAPMITVARDGVQNTSGYGNGGSGHGGYGNGSSGNGSGGNGSGRVLDPGAAQSPRSASDARAAFDSLFKK